MDSTVFHNAIPWTAPDGGGGTLSGKLDKLGMAASLACAIHCLAAPLLLLLLPAAGSVWAHPSVHWILAALVLPLALIVVYRGYRRHRRRSAMVAAVSGAACIAAALVMPGIIAHVPPEPVEALAGTGSSPTPFGVAACADACCPTFTRDASTGAFALSFPPGSMAALAGSVLLILAHAINLHGCHCFSRTWHPDAAACGCPSTIDTPGSPLE